MAGKKKAAEKPSSVMDFLNRFNPFATAAEAINPKEKEETPEEKKKRLAEEKRKRIIQQALIGRQQ